MFKVGDWVTQSDEFYDRWNLKKFHLKIKFVNDDIIYLDGELILRENSYSDKSTRRINFLHEDYLKLDTQYIRTLKLRKINESKMYK